MLIDYLSLCWGLGRFWKDRMLFPVCTWVVICIAGIDISINNYRQNMNTTPITLPPSIDDRDSAIQLGNIVGQVSVLLQTGLVYHMALISRQLSFLTPDIRPTIRTVYEHDT